MRSVPIMVACAFALPAVAAPAAMLRYDNARYGYSIAYPAELIPEPESANDDGRAFHSSDGQVRVLVWANYNALSQTPTELAKQAEGDCGASPSYQRIAANFFAMSCVADTRIIYQKTLIHGDLTMSFLITYPVSAGAQWGAVTTLMANSMRAL
jgi:hypothetical protein